ncbi:MAG: HAD-IA family hydrolase [Clostridiales bacterium]|nr:HAD-IA family hydrolase [Clostridiales bacterium]
MINTVIFDIGMVLLDFDWGEYIYRLFDRETAETVREAIFGGSLWNELDRGVMSRDEMLAGFAANAPGYENEIRIAFDRVGDALGQRDFTVPWIKELKSKGLRVLYLSNYSHHVMQCNPKALSFTDYMDGGIFSCNVKLIKPDHRIYERLMEEYGLTPSECVFIDDNAANIAAAGELGISTVLYKDYEQAYNELNKILINA